MVKHSIKRYFEGQIDTWNLHVLCCMYFGVCSKVHVLANTNTQTQVHVLWCEQIFLSMFQRSEPAKQRQTCCINQKTHSQRRTRLLKTACTLTKLHVLVSNYMYLCKLHVLWVQKKMFSSASSDRGSSHLYDWDIRKHPQKSKTWWSENWHKYMYFAKLHVLWVRKKKVLVRTFQSLLRSSLWLRHRKTPSEVDFSAVKKLTTSTCTLTDIEKFQKVRKKIILEPGVLGRVFGHMYVWDIREDRTWPRIRWPGETDQVAHDHTCNSSSWYFCCFVVFWIVVSNRGCLFCIGVVFGGLLVLGGHAKTFLFEKLHAQFAVLQIARTRA